MFAQLGTWLTSFLTGYVGSAVGLLATALAPVALIWLTVYIASYGYAVVRGEASDPFATFAWKTMKMMFVLAIALSGARFMDIVFTTADGLQDGMATIFLRGGQFNGSSPATVFGSLDGANTQANALLRIIWEDAGVTRLDLVVASIFFSLGTAIFLVLGAFVAILSKVVLAFCMAVGPIAVLTLMFRSTAKFFDAWLSTVMSAVVLAWFVFFALGLSLYVVERLLIGMEASGTFSSGGLVNAIQSSTTYLIFMVLLGILLYQSPHLASALTGGASVRTGATAAARYGFGGNTTHRLQTGNGASTPASGGFISRNAGASYYVGMATGASVRAAAAVHTAGMSAGRAAVNTGVAAFQRVARRGNRT